MNTPIFTYLRRFAVAVVLSITAVAQVMALDLSTYAEQSVLSKGRWVKIAVSESGLYMIPTSTLRSWGFSDMSKVRIHGYGGVRIPDVLSKDNYVDDLPQVASEAVDAGVVFYAVGPGQWEQTYSGNLYYHLENSPYTTRGYYFVTESDSVAVEIPKIGTAGIPSGSEAITQVQGRVHHEIDQAQATEAGPLMVGEDFRYTPTRSIKLSTPGRIGGQNVQFECQFVARTLGVPSNLKFTINDKGVVVNSSDRISATSNSQYIHASLGVARHNVQVDGEGDLTFTIAHSSTGVVHKANLDYLSVVYQRALTLPSTGNVEFWTNGRTLSMSNAKADMRLWDVSEPLNICSVNYELGADGKASWQAAYSGMRSYAAWSPDAALPAPEFVAAVANQNLHAVGEPVDMVIFTSSTLTEQANRIKSLHETNDSMSVEFVDVSKVYNEFSSGAPDISGLRKYLKMVYDRGNASGRPLRYALLLGRTTLDHREVLSTTKALGYTTMPSWVVRQARNSMSDNDGYATDDFLAMLGDNSGSDLGFDDLSVAVGRIPMVSARDGAEIVDKLYQYVNSSKRTGWKNRLLVLADDEDLGVHLRQAESMVDNIINTPDQQHWVTKVYLDAYRKSSGAYPDARREMFQALDEGVVWWIFSGHANNHSWTGDGQLTYTDINSMYLRNLPFVVAATCDFLRWDSETTSGGEIMYKERYGGAIGMISATRPVFISDNGYFVSALGRAIVSRDEQGRLLTSGEVYRRTKNDIRNSEGTHVTNSNRLRFVFMGDPALRLMSPDNIVELLTINGQAVDPDEQITLAAMGNTTITGRIVDPQRRLLSDFNGTVNVEIFDALKSITTYGNGEGTEDVFDTQGDKLFAGAARVVNGEFTLSVAMPATVADNFRPAMMSFYANSDNTKAEAIGVNRDFYVYGYEEPAVADTIAPQIRYMLLNHSGFVSGESVNSAPMLLAEVSDNVGINLSSTGVGHQMSVTIDGSISYSDVATFYTPNSDGSTIGGTISYAFENLSEGSHTMRLRVFDTSGNMAEQEIDFVVDNSLTPQIFDVYSDANPASSVANFYVTHDRPDGIVSVTVDVFDLMGRPIWSGTSKGMSDMNTSAPVSWDLTDTAGRRVSRGIYLYRASISTNNSDYQTASRRIAVTAE